MFILKIVQCLSYLNLYQSVWNVQVIWFLIIVLSIIIKKTYLCIKNVYSHIETKNVTCLLYGTCISKTKKTLFSKIFFLFKLIFYFRF